MIERIIPLKGNFCEVVGSSHVRIHFKSKMVLDLKDSKRICVIDKEEDNLKVKTLRKWWFKVKSMVQTWTNLIEKYSRNPMYTYIVRPVFKYFPIVCEIEDNKICVNNYLGLKVVFKIPIKNYTEIKKDKKDIIIKTYDDIMTGSDLEKLKALRYKTCHKNLDRRIFTDGFYIEKNEQIRS